MEYIVFKNEKIPLIGFGSWTIGDNKEEKQDEIETMIYGIKEHDMTLIDTAEMYGLGKSEEVLSEVIASFDRDKLFIVDKILPSNAKRGQYIKSCKDSLKRLNIAYFDLYLLHWRSDVDLQTMVNEMEQLVALGLIKHWGVSNFDVSDMEDLFKCHNGDHCFCNQVLYNIANRGVEFDLLPWCIKNNVLFMAYSPLGNNDDYRHKIALNNVIQEVAKEEDMTPESLMINFVIRNKNIVAIFKTASINHLNDNMKNVFKEISDNSKEKLEKAYPSPKKKIPLVKI